MNMRFEESRSGHEESLKIIPIKEAGPIANMEAMPRGIGAQYLECSTHETEKGITLIAMNWRRKPPTGIVPWHRIVDFGPRAIKRKVTK